MDQFVKHIDHIGFVQRYKLPHMKEIVNDHARAYMNQYRFVVPPDAYRVPTPSLKMSYEQVGAYVPHPSDLTEEQLRPAKAIARAFVYRQLLRPCDGSKLSTYDQIREDVNQQTSPAWPYNGCESIEFPTLQTKGAVLAYLGDTHRQKVSYVLHKFDEQVRTKTATRWPVVYVAQLKEEVRKHLKAARNFQSGPLDFYFARATYLRDMNDRLIAMNTRKLPLCPPLSTWYNPGYNQYHGNWHRMHSKLCKVSGPEGRVFSYDFSGWDRSVVEHWLTDVVDIEWMLLDSPVRTSHNREVMHRMNDAMLNGLVLMEDGALYRTGVGMKSGDYCTTSHNTKVHMLAMATAVAHIGLAKGKQPDEILALLSDKLWCQFAGDDGIGAIADNEWVTAEEIRDQFTRMGFKFKSFVAVQRDRVLKPRNTSEIIDFCSKRFVERSGIVCGSPDLTKMICKLVYGCTTTNVKLNFRRILAIRREAWPNAQLFDLLDKYVTQYVLDYTSELVNQQPDDDEDDSWEKCCVEWDTPLMLCYLHTGLESGNVLLDSVQKAHRLCDLAKFRAALTTNVDKVTALKREASAPNAEGKGRQESSSQNRPPSGSERISRPIKVTRASRSQSRPFPVAQSRQGVIRSETTKGRAS